mgnify:CR=1 FL=1
MKIVTSKFYQPNFVAHTYKIRPKSYEIEVRTDNEPNLGEEPYLVPLSMHAYFDSEIKMDKDKGVYSAKIPEDKIIKYHIDYKDTGKVDLKDGKDYTITNYKKMKQDASLVLRNQYRQPLVHAINPGKTIGRVVYAEKIPRNIEEIKEPFIMAAPNLFYYKVKNPNLVGMIYTSEDCANLSHGAAQLRQYTDVCASIYNPKDIEKLENLNGKK